MKKTVFLIFPLLFIIFGCSATGIKSDNKLSTEENKPISPNEKLAQDYFIKGAILDLQGDYTAAILEYLEALKLDEQAGIHNSLSKDYIIIQKLAPALEHAKAAVRLSPNDAEFNFMLGSIYKMAQIPDSAEIVFQKVIEIDSLNFPAYYQVAQLNEAKKPLKALEIYNRLIDLSGPEWNVLIKIAELNERIGNVDNTVKTVEKLLELDPSNLRLQKLLIESFIKTGNNEKAISLASDALNMFPDDLTLIEYKGNAKANQNKWEEAAIEYQKLIHSELPFEAKKRIAAGFVTEAANDSSIIPIAKNLLLEIEKDSTDWQTNAFLGEIALHEGNDSTAISYFSNAAHLAPWNSQLWSRFGVLLFEAQKFEETVVEMKTAVNNFPDDFVINLILGLSLSQQKDIDGASRALEHAVRLNPNDLTALHAYGFTLNQQKRYDAALTYLDRALNLAPDNIQVIGTMGMIYDAQKDYVMTDSLYERALKIDSLDVLISNNYAYSLSERGIELDKALKLAEFAVKMQPKNSSYLDTIGWVHFKLGDYKKAIEFIEQAIVEDEGNATLFDHLADVYEKINNKEKAIELYKKALSLDPEIPNVKEKLEKMSKA
ncbi:MAG: tetratricopeptide repeat protein [Bacteroidetes bacterium]|nr:tetratricopeptide repeat protein [Bacteroidota bacterium]MBU1114765.1 tetratricopeptide repeat protein [Bacteroidota bacterium]MBU1797788.1 tetratricopeptide repeat protein [Bacteroidota bacterium]